MELTRKNRPPRPLTFLNIDIEGAVHTMSQRTLIGQNVEVEGHKGGGAL